VNLIDRIDEVSSSVEINISMKFEGDRPIVSDNDIVPSNYQLDEVQATVYDDDYVDLRFFGQRLTNEGVPDKRSRSGGFYLRDQDLREEFRAYALRVKMHLEV
jgi:hypothetical protein